MAGCPYEMLTAPQESPQVRQLLQTNNEAGMSPAWS